MRKMLYALLLWQFGCAQMAQSERTAGCGWTPDPEIHGAHLDTDDCQAAFCHTPDLKPRIRDLIEAAADYWGTGNDVLYGWKIRLVDGRADCAFFHANGGCVDWFHMTVVVSSENFSVTCIERSVLIHEIGHVAIAGGDPGHIDGRFGASHYEHVLLKLTEPLEYTVNAVCKYNDDYICYAQGRGLGIEKCGPGLIKVPQ